MSNIILPPDEARKGLYNRAAAIPLKHLRSNGSITAPDKSGTEVLPPSPERAALWASAPAEPMRHLFPDGSVRDMELGGGSGGTDLTKGGVINGNLEINGNFILHGNETIDGNLMIGDREIATRQFLLSVTPPRDAADRSGITMHVVNNGAATYSFFAGMDTLTETITIGPLDQFVIADSDDFPELLWYQGDPLIEVGTVLTLESGGITEQSVKVIVGDGMAIMNFDAENPLVLNEGSIFMFNKVLLLGSPEDAQGAAIQPAQAGVKNYASVVGFMDELREKMRGKEG